MAKWTEDGKRLIPNTDPVEVPLHLKQTETMEQKIARQVSQELSLAAEAKGMESMEDSMDFDMPDEDDIFPASQFERTEMEEEFYKPDFEEIPEPDPEKVKELTEYTEEELKKEMARRNAQEIEPEKNERENDSTS